MRIKFTLFLFSLVATSVLFAQGERYLDQVFDEVEVTSNVKYGENFTALFIPVLGTMVKQPLVMDVYQPAGDTVKSRPLVVYLHTGNFLPIRTNLGLTGTKTDSATVEVCTRLAKMGYVVASADYRLGYNPLAPTQPERALGLINAAYRGLQDTRTCIRFFKKDFSELGDNYGVDTSRIVVWGEGTGGYISLAAATLDDFNEVLTTTTPAGKFLTDLNGDGQPDPMLHPSTNGDIYGTTTVVWPGDPLGAIPAGDTMCLANHVGYSSDFHMTVNMGGALADISWLEADGIPMITFQVPLDAFAPYESAILRVPGTNDAIIEVQGGLMNITTANNLGLNDAFNEVDDMYTEAARAASARAGHDYQEGLYPFVRGLNMFGLPEGSPWNWWQPSVWDTIPHPRPPMGFEGASFHQISLLQNADMSAEKGRAYIDTIVGYYAPRAFAALGLGTSTNVTNLDRTEVGFSVGPNPSAGLLRMQSDSKNPMLRARIVDISGKTVWYHHHLNVSQYEVNHQGLSPGMYILEVGFDEGTVVEKIMVE